MTSSRDETTLTSQHLASERGSIRRSREAIVDLPFAVAPFTRPRQRPRPSFNSRIVDGQPTETSFKEIQEEFDVSERSVLVYKFSRLERGETLTEHVNRIRKIPEKCIGPTSEKALIYESPRFVQQNRDADIKLEVASPQNTGWRNTSTIDKEWGIIVKNLSSGVFSPLRSRGISFDSSDGSSPSRWMDYCHHSIILNEPDGQWWGLLTEYTWLSDGDKLKWSLRDSLAMQHSSSILSILTAEGGEMLWQNVNSMELFGCQNYGSDKDQHNFLDLFFGPNGRSIESLESEMRACTAKGGTYRCRLEVSHPALRSLCHLCEGQEMHLDCQVTEAIDPNTLEKIFIFCQTDVTETVAIRQSLEREVNLRRSLEAERDKLNSALQKQNDLIECLRWVGEVGRRAGTRARASQLIDSVKRKLSRVSDVVTDEGMAQSLASFHDLDTSSHLLGQGGYGSVFKGRWRDLVVAVKRMVLPSELSHRDKRQMMALMELAITSTLLHPNIVKTHSYSIRPIRDSPLRREGSSTAKALVAAQPAPSSFEIQIIMEYMDFGTLFGALEVITTGDPRNYRAILDIALDIARGMQHLHSCNVVHSDLKPHNILLQSSPDTPKGFVAKVADFGLSVCKEDALSSHISGFHNGTSSHMAPEILTGSGSQGNASDVYSFGILLYELYSGAEAYLNLFHTNFEQMVVDKNLRPNFPPGTPDGYKDLAAACWSPDRSARPSFEAIVSTLESFREAEGGETEPLDLTGLDIVSSSTVVGLASMFSTPLPSVAEHVLPEQQGHGGPQGLTPNDREFWEMMFGCK